MSLEKDVTWGDLKEIHRIALVKGPHPDDILSDPEMLALSKTKDDDEYFYDISPEEAQELKEIRDRYDPEKIPGTISVTISQNGEVLELVKETDHNLYVREEGGWYVVQPDQGEPRIFDQTLADVSEDFVEYWDRLRVNEAKITKEVIQDYLV
jgi:hypothetical protein